MKIRKTITFRKRFVLLSFCHMHVVVPLEIRNSVTIICSLCLAVEPMNWQKKNKPREQQNNEIVIWIKYR